MKRLTHHVVSALSLTSVLIISTFPALAGHRPDMTRFPNEGNLTYDGQYFAQGFFYWHNVGGWRTTTNRPGLEFDVALTEANYFESCTSYNNLPQTTYDDCPTVGASEPSGKSFGTGTFDARNIRNYVWYRADWSFSGGTVSSSDVKLAWQEVEHNICEWDSIWCMGGVGGNGNAGYVVSGAFSFGQKFYERYYY